MASASLPSRKEADAAAVAYGGCFKAAKARDVDFIDLVDTSRAPAYPEESHGRNPKKVKRVIEREGEGSNIQVLLVLDATTGQTMPSIRPGLFHEAI